MTGYANVNNVHPRWSGLETHGMKEAKCSLLLQEEVDYDAKIKALPRQRVMVYQDKGFNNNPASAADDCFYVDFKGATILQLEPIIGGPQKTMPITITVGGRCLFTPENYQDFRVMMRTKEQSEEMQIAPNGSFDWPDVNSLLLCPVCGKRGRVPDPLERQHAEYWMIFYPLLQITVLKSSQMTLGTRTICRLTCVECMENLLEGLTLKVQPGGLGVGRGSGPSVVSTVAQPQTEPDQGRRLCFTLPASEVLTEAGSASFLEDGPPRPDTHPHVDDILDAWTLYNLWEHSGAWEALQNDYRILLSRSMHADPAEMDPEDRTRIEPRLKERIGKPCGNIRCGKVHGRADPQSGETVRLSYKCLQCHAEYYCSKACREIARGGHQESCLQRQRDREEVREKRAKKVSCDTCQKKLPFNRMKKCSRCRNATYCSVDCQRIDWERHKAECR